MFSINIKSSVLSSDTQLKGFDIMLDICKHNHYRRAAFLEKPSKFGVECIHQSHTNIIPRFEA